MPGTTVREATLLQEGLEKPFSTDVMVETKLQEHDSLSLPPCYRQSSLPMVQIRTSHSSAQEPVMAPHCLQSEVPTCDLGSEPPVITPSCLSDPTSPCFLLWVARALPMLPRQVRVHFCPSASPCVHVKQNLGVCSWEPHGCVLMIHSVPFGGPTGRPFCVGGKGLEISFRKKPDRKLTLYSNSPGEIVYDSQLRRRGGDNKWMQMGRWPPR